MKIKLLFVDDEEKFLRGMAERLRLRGVDVHSFSGGDKALEAVQRDSYDVALIDLRMPGMQGEELLGRLKQIMPAMEVVILTGQGSVESAKQTFRAGAYDYLQKPCELDELISVIARAYAKRLQAKNEAMKARAAAVIAGADGCTPFELLRMLEDLEG